MKRPPTDLSAEVARLTAELAAAGAALDEADAALTELHGLLTGVAAIFGAPEADLPEILASAEQVAVDDGSVTWQMPFTLLHYGGNALAIRTGSVAVPTAPSALVAVGGDGQIDLAWTDNATSETSYRIERSEDGSTWAALTGATALPANTTTYTDSPLAASATWHYRVFAVNSAGDSTASGSDSATTNAAPVPASPSLATDLVVSVATPGQANLTWTAPSAAPTGYIVERTAGQNSVGPWQEVGRTVHPTVAFSDRRARPGRIYTYRVRCYSTTGGVGAESSSVAGTATEAPTGVPTSPTWMMLGVTNIGALPASASQIGLAWNLLDWPDTGTVETSIKVERSPDGTTGWATIKTLPARVTTYRDTGRTASTIYYYRITPSNSAGDATPSAVVSATTLSGANVASPTGRNPRGIWTPQLQAVWTQMVADYTANPASAAEAVKRYAYIKSQADSDNTASPPYAGDGRFAALAYQMTGSGTYSAKAIGQAGRAYASTPTNIWLMAPPSANAVRESTLSLVDMWDILYPALTAQQRIDWIAGGNFWMAQALGKDAIYTGAVVSGATPTTTSFRTDLDSQINNHYSPGTGSSAPKFKFTSGALTGAIVSGIATYNATTHDVTTSVMSQAPAIGDTFQIGYWGYAGGMPAGDSDQTTAPSLALTAWDRLSAPDNALAGTLATAMGEGSVPIATGGYAPTAHDQANIRNAVAWYCDCALGGEWIESRHYNMGTMGLIGMGAALNRGTALGESEEDPYSDAYSVIERMGMHLIPVTSPDMLRTHSWGDNDGNINLQQVKWEQTVGLSAGLNRGLPVGPYLENYFKSLFASGIASSTTPYFRAYRCSNPYDADTVSWRDYPQASRAADGIGSLAFHDDLTDSNSTIVEMTLNNFPPVHHAIDYWDLDVYRKGTRTYSCPIGYGDIHPRRATSMCFAGLPLPHHLRGVVGAQSGTRWGYGAATTHGPFYSLPYYNPPPTYLHEWTRSMFWLGSAGKSSDVVVIFDRAAAQNPFQLSGGIVQYRTADEVLINAAPSLQQWIMHFPTATPTRAAGYTEWPVGSQTVRIRHLLPTDFARGGVLDEATTLAAFSWLAGERKWQERLYPATAWPGDATMQYVTWLNVLEIQDAGATVTSAAVASSAGEAAAGVLVTQTGETNKLVMFGARQAERWQRSGYTVGWTGAAEVYLADLDPRKSWTRNVDGAGAVALTVSEEGVATLSVAGSGAHTLVLVGT